MNESDLTEVVPPMAGASADEEFQRWLDERHLDRAEIADDIRVDTLRGADGSTLRRYFVTTRLV